MDTHTAPVVVAIDGTRRSAGAIDYAVVEAQARRAPLKVVHVAASYTPMATAVPHLPPADALPALLEGESRALLGSAVGDIAGRAPDVDVEAVLLSGSRSSAIVQAASGADLLVLGRETRHGIERLTVGATTLKVAGHAHCPVAVVPAGWHEGPAQQRLVVGISSMAHGPQVLSQAFEMAAERNAELLVLHAWRMPDPYIDRIEAKTNLDHWLAEGKDLLDEVLTPWRQVHPEAAVKTRVVHSHSADALLDAGRDADLVLLAKRSHVFRGGEHLGGTARAVLSHTTTPVLVLPADGTGVSRLDLEDSRSALR